jgi:hypothetical protein
MDKKKEIEKVVRHDLPVGDTVTEQKIEKVTEDLVESVDWGDGKDTQTTVDKSVDWSDGED